MPPLNLLIKPASGNCTLRCRYCFYADEASHREVYSYGVMRPEVIEAVVRKALSRAEHSVTFGFQGGEPTLAGLEFFKETSRLVRQYNARALKVQYAIQTNGTLLNQEWAEFLAESEYLVGISLDGPQRIHDRYRADVRGEGTFYSVMRGIEHLRKAKAEFNVLSVVTAQSARETDRIYKFFKKNGLLYQQYIPCIDPIGDTRGGQEFSLTPELYALFLKSLFDLWFDDMAAGRFVYIRHFQNLLNVLSGYPPEHCGMLGRCAMQTVVEADGSVYPCDFYAVDRYRLGNLLTDDFDEIERKLVTTGFIEESLARDGACARCRWWTLCRGGCRRDRDFGNALQLNYFCPAYSDFFEYSVPRFIALRDRLSSTR